MTSESELLERDDAVVSDAMKIRFFPFGMAAQDGSRLTGVDDQKLVDFTASWAVANTGYRHPVVRERVESQLRDAMANSPLSIPHEPVVRLAERLRDLVPTASPAKVWFGHSGSEAGDLVSKAIPAKGDGDTVVTFEGSYHGITAGAASISGHGSLDGFDSEDVVTLPFPNRFRADCSPEALTERALDRVAEAFAANDVAGLVTEPLQSDGGILVPPPGFLDGLADLCADHDAYFVVDEVKAGLGRTGEPFGFQHADVVPDAVVLGKPLGSGLPISAVVGRAELVDFEPAGHMLTTAASPLPVAAALGTLDVIEDEDLPGRAARLGDLLADRLGEIAADSPVVGDVRGRGLMQGVEIVTEEGSDPNAELTGKIPIWAREHGLVQFYVGTESNVLEITPPLTISEATLEEGCARLAAAIEDGREGVPDGVPLERYAGW